MPRILGNWIQRISQQNNSAYVISYRNDKVTDFKTSWKSLLKFEKLEAYGYRIHDLRHSFASGLGEDNANQKHIQQILGHRRAETTAIYTNIGEECLQNDMDRFATKVFPANWIPT